MDSAEGKDEGGGQGTERRADGRTDGRADRRRRGSRDDRDVPGLPSVEPPSVNVWPFLEGQLNI